MSVKFNVPTASTKLELEEKMKKIALVLTMVSLSFGSVASAHSKKEALVPADGSTIQAVPDNVELRFNDGMRLTKMDMTHASHPSVAVDLGDVTGFAKEYVLPIQSMGAGPYTFEWRGLGADGHPMTGTFSFTVE